jgi:hypothetical protein
MLRLERRAGSLDIRQKIGAAVPFRVGIEPQLARSAISARERLDELTSLLLGDVIAGVPLVEDAIHMPAQFDYISCRSPSYRCPCPR